MLCFVIYASNSMSAGFAGKWCMCTPGSYAFVCLHTYNKFYQALPENYIKSNRHIKGNNTCLLHLLSMLLLTMHYLPLASLTLSWQSGTTSVGLHYGQPGLEMHALHLLTKRSRWVFTAASYFATTYEWYIQHLVVMVYSPTPESRTASYSYSWKLHSLTPERHRVPPLKVAQLHCWKFNTIHWANSRTLYRFLGNPGFHLYAKW